MKRGGLAKVKAEAKVNANTNIKEGASSGESEVESETRRESKTKTEHKVKEGGKSPASLRLLYDNFRYEVRVLPCVGECEVEGEGKGRVRAVLVEKSAWSERVVGRVEGWRARALVEVDGELAERDNRERGFRLFLALQLLKTVDAGRGREALLALKALTLEETIFWVWQYHSYGKRALGALKHMHMGTGRRVRP